MFCRYYNYEQGRLKPFDVLQAGTAGYFAQSQERDPEQVDKAAREHFAKQPAWFGN